MKLLRGKQRGENVTDFWRVKSNQKLVRTDRSGSDGQQLWAERLKKFVSCIKPLTLTIIPTAWNHRDDLHTIDHVGNAARDDKTTLGMKMIGGNTQTKPKILNKHRETSLLMFDFNANPETFKSSCEFCGFKNKTNYYLTITFEKFSFFVQLHVYLW